MNVMRLLGVLIVSAVLLLAAACASPNGGQVADEVLEKMDQQLD